MTNGNNKYKILFIITILLVIGSLPEFILNSISSNDNNNLKNIKEDTNDDKIEDILFSNDHKKMASSQTIHRPISISSDDDFKQQAIVEGWGGNGTEDNPYIIEGYKISNETGTLIYIANVNSSFKIQNNILFGSSTAPRDALYADIGYRLYWDVSLKGIEIISTKDAIIENNVIYNTAIGIFLTSNKTTINNNSLYNMTVAGIVSHWCHDAIIINNKISDIYPIYEGLSYHVDGEYNPRGAGIFLMVNNKANVSYNTITRTNNGMYFGYWSISRNVTISRNLLSNNNYGMYSDYDVFFADFSVIYNIFDSNIDGINLDANNYPPTKLNNSIFLGNFFHRNLHYGLCLTGDWGFTLISENLFFENGDYGLRIVTSNVTVSLNDFISNNREKVQAADFGENNSVKLNYWNDLKIISENNSSQAIYKLDGNANNMDGSILDGPIAISLLLEKGVLSYSFLQETKTNLRTDTTTLLQIDLEIQKIMGLILGIVSLTLIISLIAVVKLRNEVNTKRAEEQRNSSETMLEIIAPNRLKRINYLRDLYHKLLIGLESSKKSLFDEFQELDTSEVAVVGNIFPDDIRYEMKSEFRGRTILVLIELAFQPLKYSHQSYLADKLNIPRQTMHDELLKLRTLGYIKIFHNSELLADSRFKYYSLTQKGFIFLHIVKETISYSITHVDEKEMINY